MSENPESNVRRYGSQDRKDYLPPTQPKFPPPEPALPTPDFDALIPDVDQAALASLAALPQDVLRPIVIAPPEERYPPLPDQVKAVAPAKPPTKPATQSKRPRPTTPRRRWNGLYNFITLLALVGCLALVGIYTIIWNEPQSWLNPFPPPIEYVQITATPAENGATSPTSQPAEPTIVPIISGYPFSVVSTLYVANANISGCNWASIAGSVVDAQGAALNGYRVRITGAGVEEVVFSGAALTFGAGGFELPLGNAPQSGDFAVQLFSPQGAPLSEPHLVTTRATCEENVTLVNFQQTPS
jgi:hypothetical protein